ncbi:response regulator [Streptomyces phaeolivaceus]|uniref:Circadian input-output histidine kinase CikA n=2 Tax=Streptomyces phaeolivaceus TaxID=2653200 RepID=A0A5P8KJ10_9ACTN|nr:response regulator [Streptomyces phaeolivaceus]
MTAARDGSFTKTPETGPAPVAELCALFNQIIGRSTHFGGEVQRVRRELVRHGRLDERLSASPGQGAWAPRVDDVNQTLDALVAPAANATRVLDAVAGGDLTQRVDLHDGNRQLRGDLRRLGRAVNKMVDQLSLFTGEVTRVAREVGTEGRLGGRAKVRGLSGSWRDVTEAVNTMAARLTAQVRDIALVTTSVARGDLTRTESLLGESQRLAMRLQERSDELQTQQAELQRSNAELEEKAALLATSSQYKSEFLANMSHELRTPLNSLLILARLLSDNPDGHLTDQEVQFATTIHRSGSDLQLINDILDLSKIEAGRMDVRPKRLPLIKVLDYVHATFRPLTLDRGLAFEVTVGEDVPREMYSDEQLLQQILRNLLSNAIKFTASGRVEPTVSRVKDTDHRFTREDHAEVIAFAVADTGIGITAEKLPVIFEAFQQADGTTNRKYRGTGLGLSISREIAGLLGGRIIAESVPGKGSTFTLYVPVVSPGHGVTGHSAEEPGGLVPEQLTTEPYPAAHDTEDTWPAPTKLEAWKAGRAGQVLPGRRVLIVDDDIRNVFALTHVLGRVGMPVLYAENGREGIETLERNPDVELVLMDIMMPEMDGYETISAIRRTPRWAGLPIVALTAKAMPGDREKSIVRGANDYVPKPVDVDQLLTVVCAVLDPDGAEGPEGGAGPSPEIRTEENEAPSP